MLATILATSLWAASQQTPTPQEWLYPQPEVVTFVPVETIADAVAVDLALLGAGAGADLISTDYSINHGGRELNPLAPRPEGRVGLKMGAGALRGSLAYLLRRTGHKSTANVIRWLGLAVDLGVSIHNVQVGRRGK